ncbi:MAG: hypothetical protein ACKO7B_07875, partial [Flavobacteriales bacterium]
SLSGAGTPNAANTTLSIGGKMEITSGRLDFNTGTSTVGNMLVNLSGDLTVSGTGTIARTANLTNRGIFRFNKSTGTQTISALSTSLPGNIDYEVGNGTTAPVATLASDFIINNASRLTVRTAGTLDCPGAFAVDGSTTTNGAFTLQSGATL